MQMRFETINEPIARSRAIVVRFAAFLISAILLPAAAVHAAGPEDNSAIEFKRAY
jgi:hypothetical protein